jgi:hypothetical protein
MKRLLTSAAMFLCSLLTFAQFSGSGSGTESDPYLIMNPIQLNQLRNFLNKEGVYFKMMADVDLTEYLEDESPSQGWQPVGNSTSAAFKGILDGNGKTVSGLWINRGSNNNVGFFGYTSKATVKNLTIVANTIAGKENVGGISGYSDNSAYSIISISGKIQGASNVGGAIGGSGDNLTMTDITANVEVSASGDYVGGLIGKNDAYSNLAVSGCHVNSSNISGNNYIGGVCGGNVGYHNTSNSLSFCYIYADVMGKERVGGICGFSANYHTVNLNNCGFVGNINGTTCVGGLVGYINKTDWGCNDVQKNCFAICSVTATGDYAGGLIGYDIGCYHTYYYYVNNVSNSYFSGTVSGMNYTAGLVGYKQYGTVSNCYTTASVAGAKYVGGLVGYNESSTAIKTSVAINTRVTATEGEVGRVVGYNKGTIPEIGTTEENKSYNRTIIISQGVAQDIVDDKQNGTGVSFTTLKLKATYVAMGWDFNDTWEIQETECYPYMKAQTAPPVITSRVVSGATSISGKCVDGGTVTLEIDGVKQQMVSTGHEFAFTVSPMQAGHEVRISAKAEGKEQSYFTTETVQYLGSGKQNDPYQIYTASDLTGVYRKGYFKLMNDIDLTDYINQFSPTEGWQSIGREGSETIHFDGDGHKITGLWCNSHRDNTGLFSCFANGTIKNLTVVTAKGKQVKGGSNTGILIGKMINGVIENCRVSGTVADGTPVGGMCGLLDGGKILLSQASVTINTTNETSYVGGLVGEITGGEIDQCVTLGTLTATGKESYVGGLAGKSYATLTNSYSNAVVTSPYNAAGLVAYNYGIVDKCYATGNIFSSNYGAGVIGYNDGENAIVRNCVAMNSKIDVTYESQSAQSGGYGQRIIGGIKNGAPAPELNNYALKTMQVSVNNVPQKVYDDIMNGVAKTGTELVRQTTYQELGWDFTNTWTISAETEGYPSLKNNEAIVVKPEEDEPVISNDDIIRVTNVDAYKGKNVAVGVTLINKSTDLRAYQFDLTLPSGISLAKDGNGNYLVTKTSRYEDEDQALQVTLLENNTYRFVSYSMESKKITGTSGALLNIILNVASTHTAGTFEANIDNIVFTKTNGTQIKLNSAKFNIVVHKAMLGDANGDGEINVGDIVEIVKDILHKTTSRFVREAADVNEDGEINVTDIVLVANIIMGGNPNASRTRGAAANTLNDALSLCQNDNHSMSLLLRNEGGYVASQFELRLSEGQKLESISLNGERRNRHELDYYLIGDNTYQVVAYSIDNQSYSGNDGELLNIKISGSGDVEIDKILFVTESFGEKRFSSLHGGGMTGIDVAKAVEPFDIYSVDGRVVRRQAENTKGLQKGVYIIKGKKQVVR